MLLFSNDLRISIKFVLLKRRTKYREPYVRRSRIVTYHISCKERDREREMVCWLEVDC